MALIQEKWLDTDVRSKILDITGNFTLANNQSTYANITDFVLNSSISKHAKVDYSITRHHQGSLVTGANNTVYDIEKTSEGDYIIAGAFTSYNGNATRPYVCKVKKDGTLDTTWGQSNYTLVVYSLIKNSDGDYIAGGSGGKRLFRINKDTGLNDTTFNNGGAGANNNIYSVVQDENKKYIIAGAFTTYNGVTCGNIARINEDGTLDTSFNPGGSGLGASFAEGDIIALSGGKYLVSGNFTTYNGVTCNSYIIRLNSDGSIDTSFNNGGTGASAAVYGMIVDNNGKIVIVGNIASYNGNSAIPTGVVRLSGDGIVDTSFLYNITNNGTNGLASAIMQDSEGRYLVGGSFTTYVDGIVTAANAPDRLLRLNYDGTLDQTFNYGTGTRGFDANRLTTIVEIENGAYVIGANGITSYNGNSDCPDNFCQINENGNLRLFYSDYSYIQETGSVYFVYNDEVEQWIIKGETYAGSEAGITFKINGNQVQYKSSNLAGSVVTSSLKYYAKYL